ncbi:MAG: hypothetical protein R3C71_12980 [Candidatus Krumholzibacteriia bacterium]
MRSGAWLLGTLALLAVAVVPAHADTLILDYHDGNPWSPLYGVTMYEVAGNFFPGIVGWDPLIWSVWFYHGGVDYEESGVPFEIHIITRTFQTDGSVEFNVEGIYDFWTTTCNNCWEEFYLGGYLAHGHFGEDRELGVFLRPLGGTIGVQTPRIWYDCCPNYEHAAVTLRIVNPKASDRSEYDTPVYNSDYGLGEFMVGAEVTGDVIVPTRDASFSAIKSLY